MQGVVSYDYVMFEEGLKHAGLVEIDLLRACLSSNVPIVLAGHSFGVGALGFLNNAKAGLRERQGAVVLFERSEILWGLAASPCRYARIKIFFDRQVRLCLELSRGTPP